jgi:hypothetical protein
MMQIKACIGWDLEGPKAQELLDSPACEYVQ